MLGFVETLRHQTKTMRSTFDFPGQETGTLEHPEVFRCRGLGNVERLPQLACGARASPGQHCQHGSPGSISQCVERAVEHMIVMYSHMTIL